MQFLQQLIGAEILLLRSPIVPPICAQFSQPAASQGMMQSVGRIRVALLEGFLHFQYLAQPTLFLSRVPGLDGPAAFLSVNVSQLYAGVTAILLGSHKARFLRKLPVNGVPSDALQFLLKLLVNRHALLVIFPGGGKIALFFALTAHPLIEADPLYSAAAIIFLGLFGLQFLKKLLTQHKILLIIVLGRGKISFRFALAAHPPAGNGKIPPGAGRSTLFHQLPGQDEGPFKLLP